MVVTAEGPVPSQGFDNEFETDEKFEDDAYVLYTYSLTAKEIKSVEAAKKVEGTVTVAENSKTDLDEKKALTIDDTRYKAAVKVGGEDIGEVSVKQDYTIYLDSYGYMIYVEENEEIGDYALVLQTAGLSPTSSARRLSCSSPMVPPRLLPPRRTITRAPMPSLITPSSPTRLTPMAFTPCARLLLPRLPMSTTAPL